MSVTRCPWAVSDSKVQYHDLEWGSFDTYLWSWVDGTPIVNHPQSMADLLVETPLSRALSTDLKKRGFKFVGPTIVYAYMQSAGLVNDHMAWCPWHDRMGQA